MVMQRVGDASSDLAWLQGGPGTGAVTGFDALGWPTSRWVLHAMYENQGLNGLGTYDDLRRERLAAGEVAPLIIGEVNLEERTTLSGTTLGFTPRPAQPWRRLRWAQYLARFPEFTSTRAYPPSHGWFPAGSWPVSIVPPPEGSLDEASFDALLEVIAAQCPQGLDTPCCAFYAGLPAGDFDTPHLWRGPLGAVSELLQDRGGPYDSTPSNLWPADKTWFIWTDWDLTGTKVSGSHDLIEAIDAADELDTTTWTAQPL